MHTIQNIKLLLILSTLIINTMILSCTTMPAKDGIFDKYSEYLEPDPEADELFRVLIISDRYVCSQMRFEDKLTRSEDTEGDRNICDKLKEYDKIDEVAEGILTVWLYPKSGKLMKIRPKALAPIAEVNGLIVEDLKRWNFQFESEEIEPNIFNIKYKVVLRKMVSDEEIMKEVMEKVKEEEAKKKWRASQQNADDSE
ncbi:MAG: hypothetical protein JW864_01365 [Spirochaetes bacterium]|nr:hypothetical protein [Spirochaetota bacterium]